MKKLLAVGFSLLVAGVACADKVTLKSGSFLTGSVVATKSGEITFKSDDLGEVTIKIENIAKLEDAGLHEVQFTDGTVASNTLAVADGKYLANQKPLDMTKVKEIDPVPETWHGSVHVAFQSARGNSYENSGSVMLHLDRRWEKDRFNGDVGYYYSKTGTADEDAKKTTDRWEAEVKHDHFWLPKVYHYEDLRFDRDMIQNLRARYRVGLGGGYQWLEKAAFEKTGTWSFNQEFGVNWVKEEYERDALTMLTEEDEDKNGGFCALRYAHHLTWQPKWVEGMEVFHNAEILPDVAEWDKFLAKADIGFSTKIFLNFDLLTKIEWDFNSKPVADRKRDDLRFIVGLGYKW